MDVSPKIPGGGLANSKKDLAVTIKKKSEKKGDTAHTHKSKAGSATSAAILGGAGKTGKKNAPSQPKRAKPEWVKYQENLMDLRDRLLLFGRLSGRLLGLSHSWPDGDVLILNFRRAGVDRAIFRTACTNL